MRKKSHGKIFLLFFFFRNNKVQYLNLALVENIIAKINKAHKFISFWDMDHIVNSLFQTPGNKVQYLNLALVENIITKINKAHKFISFWDMDHIVYSPFQTAGNMVNSNYKFERTSRRRFYLVVSSFIQLRGHRF